VKKDLAMATELFRISADAGDSEDQHCCAKAPLHGHGVGQDLERAAEYFRHSADQGNTAGRNGLAVCLLNGHGVARDLVKAAEYFKQAMDQGDNCARNTASVSREIQSAGSTSANSRSPREIMGHNFTTDCAC
jgi:TPR repeat protein